MTRRRWWLAGLLGVAVLVRAALPEIIRRQAETRASELLHARVQIGDVDLWLLGGAVALEDVTVRPAGAPDAAPAPDEEQPVVAWRRFAADLNWWPLVHKTVQFSSVELDKPRLSVDRLANGTFNLLALVPVAAADEASPDGTPAETAEAPPDQAKPWEIGVDHLIVRGGDLRFRDLALGEASEPVDVRLPTIEVRDVALAPGVYGRPVHASVDVRVDEGRLRVNTRAWLRGGGLKLATTLRARRMPLGRVRLYVPEVGWRELDGELGASLVHRFETNEQNLVAGTLTLDGVAVRVPEVEMPALTWKHLGVVVDALDLEAHRAAIGTVELAGPTVVVRPEEGALLPALARGAQKAAAEANEDVPSAPSEPGTPEAPWRWSVDTARVTDALVHVQTDQGQRDLSVALEMHELAGDGDQPAPTKLAVTWDVASLSLEGGARIAAPGFDGTLTVSDLSLPEVPVLARALSPSVLQDARLSAALRLAAGSAATPAGDVTVAGTLDLTGVSLLGADPELFAVGFERLAVAIDELRLPGVLAPPGAERAAPVVTLASIELGKPRVQLTRTSDGLVLPSFSSGNAPTSPSPAETPSPPPAETPSPPPASPSPGAESPHEAKTIDLTVGALDVKDGELRVSDRTVTPVFSGGLRALDVDVRAFRYPALTMESLRLTARSLTRGRLQVTGKRSASGARLEVTGKNIALQPFNPYATHYSPYSIESGTLSIASEATLTGSAYDSSTAFTLDGFDLGGKEGDSLFKQQFGIPIEVALALLRDVRGRIALDVPVAGDERGTKVSVTTIAGQALRRALVNALASPLKLVGAAFGGTGKGAAPAPIPFAVGRAVPTDTGTEMLDALRDLLASRPGIGITLKARPTEADVRWLQEQALREELSQPQGLFGAIGTLAERGARERVRVALEARATGREGALDPDDAAKLEEWLAERPKPGEKELRGLVEARLERVAAMLREGHGIDAARVASAEPVTALRRGDPVVRFALGAAPTTGS